MLKLVDLQKILRDRGAPIVPFAEQQRRDQQLQAEAAAAAAPAVAPGPGTVGVQPTATGFAYVQAPPMEIIYLADSASDFIENLPPSPHYEDPTVRAFAKQLWNLYRDVYRDEYASAIDTIGESDEPVELADVELASPRQIAERLIERWKGSAKWPEALQRTLDIFGKTLRRAARVELRKANLRATLSDEEADQWVREHVAQFASQVAQTTRTEVRDFIAKRIEEGITDRQELIRLARAHFDDFPSWKADRLVRTEVRDVYNAATLLAARSAGINRVQAIDAQYGEARSDGPCIDRDGQIFTVDAAFKEDEHPNGTLAWRMVPAELSIERRADIDGAEFDEENLSLTLSTDLPWEAERTILKSVLDYAS
jgi:hypothetical protein